MSTYESMKKLELAAACEKLARKLKKEDVSYSRDYDTIKKKWDYMRTPTKTRSLRGGIL
jgi:hypothetical protein